ncbi:MAG TPA: four helix bundle protein [Flavobacteriales bacterium]|nr:four helix bundle protein [Flavobacteriales bacterium]
MHHNHKELKVWQKSIELAVEVYSATANFPNEEKFGLTSQIRRSSVSIPSNISEGAGRSSSKDFARFLTIAHGSSYELETQIIIANKLNLISNEISGQILNKLSEVQKMNYKLKEVIESKLVKTVKKK